MFNGIHHSSSTFYRNPNQKSLPDMLPLDSCLTYSSSGSSSSSCSAARTSPDQISPFIAGAGYTVASPELTPLLGPVEFPVFNPIPVDLDSLISGMGSASAPPLPGYPTGPFVDPAPTGWYDVQPPVVLPPAMDQEESSIELVHVLIQCADSVQCGNLPLAGTLVEKLRALLTLVNVSAGIGKVGGFFIEALSRRIYAAQGIGSLPISSAADNEMFYHGFYEAAPYLKFAHFTANQAILEAFNGHDCVHVIDLGLLQGLQWPALIQALALRPGGPPMLKITGMGPPSFDGRDSLHEVGSKLAGLARSLNVKFEFRAVPVLQLDEINPEILGVHPNEAVAVNSIFQLHKLLGPDPVHGSFVKAVLSWVRGLNPTIVTVVEQEANHNEPGFLDRFTEALFYYSTIFDSLETCSAKPTKSLAEMYVEREISDVVCFEGSARVERHEPLYKWRIRLSEAGFKPLYLGENGLNQASMLLTLFSASGYCVEENEGCLTMGWHNRALITASVWQPVVVEPMAI